MPTRTETKIWRSLRRRKGREETGRFLAEGVRLVGDVLAGPGRVEVVLYADGAGGDAPVRDLLRRAREGGVRVASAPPSVLGRIADTATPQGILAVVEIPRFGWADVGSGVALLLDGVQDPGNVGTLVRTAAALGAVAVVGLGPTADPWGPKAFRASAGAALRIPVFRASRAEALAELERRGTPVWVARAGAGPAGGRAAGPAGLALALGSEAHGISPEMTAAAAEEVAVPMRGGVDSLNVAVAGAILLDRLLSGRPEPPCPGGPEDDR